MGTITKSHAKEDAVYSTCLSIHRTSCRYFKRWIS